MTRTFRSCDHEETNHKQPKGRGYVYHDVGGRKYTAQYPTPAQVAERKKQNRTPPGGRKP
jgi:hypothetical protein